MNFVCACFCPSIVDKDSAGPRVLSNLTDAHYVITGQKKVNKVSKCLVKCAKYDKREKTAILCCKIPVRAKTRAHACVRVFFSEML